jgi:predicted component of type VI protein secretion system
MGSFRVHLGPVHTPVFNSYLPDRAAFSAIAEQIRFYEDQLLAWDVEVYCKTRGMASVLLGNTANALLGWNTWVFTGNLAPDHVSARFKPRVAA